MSQSQYTYYVIILGGGVGGQGHDYLDYIEGSIFLSLTTFSHGRVAPNSKVEPLWPFLGPMAAIFDIAGVAVGKQVPLRC